MNNQKIQTLQTKYGPFAPKAHSTVAGTSVLSNVLILSGTGTESQQIHPFLPDKICLTVAIYSYELLLFGSQEVCLVVGRNFTGHNVTLMSIRMHKQTTCWPPINVMKLLEPRRRGRKSCFVVSVPTEISFIRASMFTFYSNIHIHWSSQPTLMGTYISQMTAEGNSHKVKPPPEFHGHWNMKIMQSSTYSRTHQYKLPAFTLGTHAHWIRYVNQDTRFSFHVREFNSPHTFSTFPQIKFN